VLKAEMESFGLSSDGKAQNRDQCNWRLKRETG